MLRILSRNSLRWRSFFTTANRLNEIDPKITVLPTPSRKELRPVDDINIDKLDLPPPAYTQPFEDLYKDGSPADENEKHSDIAEFVDNLGPPLPIAFNLAAFVNRSESLQNLVRLGVDLSEIEKKPDRAKYIVTLDFDQHMRHHIQFLHDNGVNADEIGRIITRNPFLFKESIENMQIRINYLASKRFTKEAIARILTNNPLFLSLDTVFVDSRLGFFQKQFSLSGDEVRFLVTKAPKLISFPFSKLREKLFIFKEEFGYSIREMKTILMAKPKAFMIGALQLKERFDMVHNQMGIPHERILEFPEIFLKRGFLLKQRHLYLVHLNRAQYDPEEPLYVSLYDIATTTDVEFCEKCAKTSVDRYNEFLRTI
ncbi:hypothetical protein JTE90_028455 [Oedothorax gibbosus]|uniref:mTERF domain-containing protein 1, mitochondrial n=1 Tax=Oedothorax gibbosus TaxID=931172 RepID=A0AAV6VGW3_9ARAC|nr:hypothetical protein JTE90_028455 [Oedothorax gibbosus]